MRLLVVSCKPAMKEGNVHECKCSSLNKDEHGEHEVAGGELPSKRNESEYVWTEKGVAWRDEEGILKWSDVKEGEQFSENLLKQLNDDYKEKHPSAPSFDLETLERNEYVTHVGESGGAATSMPKATLS